MVEGREPGSPGKFPGGKQFAFTILDDTDDSTVANTRPFYQLLQDLGLGATKTVWPLDCPEGSEHFFAAQTLDDPGYREFARSLQASGFEIASHCATMETSDRERTERGLVVLKDELGADLRIHCNHGQNRENVYWRADRYRTPLLRHLARLWYALQGMPPTDGHVSTSDRFWGDLCHETFDYVRNFTFSQINTAEVRPGRPYSTPDTRYVRCWFSTSDAPNAEAFKRLVTPSSIRRLRDEGGYCILSTHVGKGYVSDGEVDPEIAETLRYLADLDGWYPTTSELLDFLGSGSGCEPIDRMTLALLEARHLIELVSSRLPS